MIVWFSIESMRASLFLSVISVKTDSKERSFRNVASVNNGPRSTAKFFSQPSMPAKAFSKDVSLIKRKGLFPKEPNIKSGSIALIRELGALLSNIFRNFSIDRFEDIPSSFFSDNVMCAISPEGTLSIILKTVSKKVSREVLKSSTLLSVLTDMNLFSGPIIMGEVDFLINSLYPYHAPAVPKTNKIILPRERKNDSLILLEFLSTGIWNGLFFICSAR